jgi:hypothetical protein
MSVPCPKCKGGCDLCSGSGVVNDSVARLYVREEARPTVRMRPGVREVFLADEVPTRPDLIKRALRRQRAETLAVVIFVTLLLTVVAVLFFRE